MARHAGTNCQGEQASCYYDVLVGDLRDFGARAQSAPLNVRCRQFSPPTPSWKVSPI
jgi:hypothetical protein